MHALQEGWAPKVICTDYDGVLKGCYPAKYTGAFYFSLYHDIDLSILDDDSCESVDIPECSKCSSEKVCSECKYGQVLVGSSYEYYGRCVCPDGYYKFGFNTSTCNKTEYIKKAWMEFAATFESFNAITDEFADYAFTVRALNSEETYLTYVIL